MAKIRSYVRKYSIEKCARSLKRLPGLIIYMTKERDRLADIRMSVPLESISDSAVFAELSRRLAAVKRLTDGAGPIQRLEPCCDHETHDVEAGFVYQQRILLNLLDGYWL